MDALILSCGTGGGHDAAARAIQEELIRRGDHAVMMNPFTLYQEQFAARINHAYIALAQHAPRGFGVVYLLGEGYCRLPWRSPIYVLSKRMIPFMESYLREHHFDVVILTHLFPAEIMTRMKQQNMEIPKTIFVATDYTCIPFTGETDCDAYIIPSEDLSAEYEKRGIPPEKLFPLGIPVSRRFSSPIEKEAAREELGLDRDKIYLLVAGGSIGAGKMKRAIRILRRQCSGNMRLIVICGNNGRLYQSLMRIYGNDIQIIRETDQMATYVRACDLYLVKPGGLSSTEAAAMGVPLIHLPPIPGCETKNLRFFQTRGMSIPAAARKRDFKAALSLVSDAQKQQKMLEKQRQIIGVDAASRVCIFAERLAEQTSPDGCYIKD